MSVVPHEHFCVCLVIKYNGGQTTHPLGTMLIFFHTTDPSQYMMALQGLLPDDEAMMNLAIALSLHEGVSGGVALQT